MKILLLIAVPILGVGCGEKNQTSLSKPVTEMSSDELDAHRAYVNDKRNANKKRVEDKIKEARSKFTKKEILIHDYMNQRWTSISESIGYDPDIHDKMVENEAAKKFGISPDEAGKIYIKVSTAGILD